MNIPQVKEGAEYPTPPETEKANEGQTEFHQVAGTTQVKGETRTNAESIISGSPVVDMIEEINKMEEAFENARIMRLGPYTAAKIEYNGLKGYGLSKCSDLDKWSAKMGEQIAVGRAKDALLNKLSGKKHFNHFYKA